MDLTKLTARVKSRFRDTANSIYSDENYQDYIIEAQRDVHAASPWWPFMETRTSSITVDSSTTELGVALPGDVIRVNAVYDATDRYSLSPIFGRADYRYYFPDPTSQRGLPTNYRLRSSFLEIYPLPASTISLTVDYQIAPPLMSAGTDEPPWPETYHQLLIPGALYRAYEDDGNFKAAEIQEAKFQQLVEDMKTDLLSSRTEQYTQMGFDDVDDIW